jgi:hypothetical protein
MDSVDVVYYTCLNNACPKHRNIFREGDPQHENCARERLYLEGQREPMPRWMWFAIPAAVAGAAVAGLLVMRMIRNARENGKPPMLRGETETKTWSGAHSHRDDRAGNAVPPPIAREG